MNNLSPFSMFLANTVKLEDVFKSTQQSINQGPGSQRALAIALGVVAIAILLLVLAQRRRQGALPQGLNHPKRLAREVLKATPLKPGDLRQLQKLANEQEVQSPLTLLLCPSLLAKAARGKSHAERQSVGKIVEKLRSK